MPYIKDIEMTRWYVKHREAASLAISLITFDWTSCEVLLEAIEEIREGNVNKSTLDLYIDVIDYFVEYSKVSGANSNYPGFNGEDWSVELTSYDISYMNRSKEIKARFNYRLEMLYYYWMANQDM